VGLVEHLRQQQQVVTTEAVGGFPLLAILVDAGDGDVEAGAVLGLILPDGGFDGTETDFMNGSRPGGKVKYFTSQLLSVTAVVVVLITALDTMSFVAILSWPIPKGLLVASYLLHTVFNVAFITFVNIVLHRK